MYRLSAQEHFGSADQAVSILHSSPQPRFPDHRHDFGEVVIVQKGCGVHVLNDQPHSINAGSVLFLRPNQDHHSFEHVSDLHLCNIHYRRESRFNSLGFIDEHLPGKVGNEWMVSSSTLNKVNKVIRQIELLPHDSISALYLQEGFLLQAIGTLLQGIYCEYPEDSADDRVRQLINFLRSNFQEHIDWHELGNRYSLPIRTLNRKVKEYTGLAPQYYIAHLRLAHACYLFRSSNMTITQVAFECGFGDSNYFATLFRKNYGMTPSQYKANYSDLAMKICCEYKHTIFKE